MNGNCHFMFGLTIGISTCVIAKTNPSDTTLLMSTCMIGSILPDIDNPKSHFGQLTKPLSTIIGCIHKLQGKKEWQHRGLFHDIGLYGLGLYLSFAFAPFLVGLFIGCLSHLFLDMFNPSGVRLGIIKRIKFASIKSGSNESILLTVIACCEVLLVTYDWIDSLQYMFVF